METVHAASLTAKHAHIDERICAEERRPSPDTFIIAQLKKEKLKLKDALAGN